MADKPTIANTVDSKSVKRMLGFDLDSWNTMMLWSLGGAALAAFLVVVSTAAVLKLQKASEEAAKAELEIYKLSVDARVADAKKEGIQAGEKAGNAEVRAAELEKEAAVAKLETEKLKSVVAWRSISQSVATKLQKILSSSPGSVNLRWMDGDPEALFLAIQLSKIFESGNWQIAAGAAKPPGQIVFGILLPSDPSGNAKTLRDAFSAADIPFGTGEVNTGIMFNVSTIQGAPTLMIGSRTPPQLH